MESVGAANLRKYTKYIGIIGNLLGISRKNCMKWQYSHMFLQRSIDGSNTKEQGTLVQLHQEYVEKILGHHNHSGISRVCKEPANPVARNRSNVGLPPTAFILGLLELRSMRSEEKT